MSGEKTAPPQTSFGRTTALGAWHGVRAFLKLMLIVAPVFTFVTLLKYTSVIRLFAEFMAPLMKHFGLPGEAALALIIGNLINLYAGLGAVTALKITSAQLTVLSLMLLLSHSQILETAVFFQIRAKWWLLWFIRLVLSLLAGVGLSRLIVKTGTTGAADAARLAQMAQMHYVGIGPALGNWARGLLLDTGLKMFLVLVGIFIILELGRRYGLMEKTLRAIGAATRFIGLKPEAGMPWLAGNVFGIVFGAGVVIETAREGQLDAKQITLVATFLALCHGLFEDTAIFLVLGANIFWILVPRIVLAVAVTWVLSKVLKEEKTRAGAAVGTA
ncbi:MAG TPA: nucleoside recognition domain-containing protein [bacterium]|nr:nucleoside recognition domain-containing protein [bacterium]